MKLIEIVNARAPLQKLVTQDLPIREAYGLMKFTELCNEHLSFYGQELAKFNPDAQPDRMKELEEMDIGTLEKITVTLNDGVRLSASDLKALEPLIIFREEE